MTMAEFYTQSMLLNVCVHADAFICEVRECDSGNFICGKICCSSILARDLASLTHQMDAEGAPRLIFSCLEEGLRQRRRQYYHLFSVVDWTGSKLGVGNLLTCSDDVTLCAWMGRMFVHESTRCGEIQRKDV